MASITDETDRIIHTLRDNISTHLMPPSVPVIADGRQGGDISFVLMMHPVLMSSMVWSSHDDDFVSTDWLDMFASDEWTFGRDGLFEEAIQDGLLPDQTYQGIDETSLDGFVKWYEEASNDIEMPYLRDAIDKAIGQARHTAIILRIVREFQDKNVSLHEADEGRYRYSMYRQVRGMGLSSVSGAVLRNVLNRYHVHDDDETAWLCIMVQWCYTSLLDDAYFDVIGEAIKVAKKREQDADGDE